MTYDLIGSAWHHVTRFERGAHVPRLATIERMCVALSLELITRAVVWAEPVNTAWPQRVKINY